MLTGLCANHSKKPAFILLTVLVMVSLLLSTVSALAVYAKNEVKRARQEEFAFRARSAASVAAQIACKWIAEDKNKYHAMTEKPYRSEKPYIFMFDETKVVMRIIPLDDRLPLGHLFLPDGVTLREEYQRAWDQLWVLLKHSDLSSILLDYMDRDKTPRMGGREESYFINRAPIDISEWLRVRGVTPALLYGSGDGSPCADRYVTPFCGEKININTVRQDVVPLLDRDLNAVNAEALVVYRKKNPIKSMAELHKIPGFPSVAVTRLENVIGFTSNYFQIELRVSDLSDERKYSVVVQRSGNKGCDVIRWDG